MRRSSTTRRVPRERGNVMVIVLVALVGLAGLGGITALSARGGTAAAGHDRFKAIALYAAESGAAATVDWLRRQTGQGIPWETYLSPDNTAVQSPVDIPGNGARPGEADNLFSADLQAWFEIELLNNPGDPGLATGEDRDGRVIIRATGHGPDGTRAQVEWEVRSNFAGGSVAHCPGYAQRGLAEDNAGRNDCLAVINAGVTATYNPGGN